MHQAEQLHYYIKISDRTAAPSSHELAWNTITVVPADLLSFPDLLLIISPSSLTSMPSRKGSAAAFFSSDGGGMEHPSFRVMD